MERIKLGKTGEKIPALGLGTFGMGGRFSPDYSRDTCWVELIKKAVEMGYTLIDTAEIYGLGHAEELVGRAIKELERDELFIISKVRPENCRFLDTLKAGLKSCERLGTYIDLYMIHSPPPPRFLPEMVRAMETLVEMGMVRYIGVSNFNQEGTEAVMELAKKNEIVANESELSLIEKRNLSLVEWCKRRGITYIAYSPLGRGDLFHHPVYERVKEVAEKMGKTPVQVALRWVLDRGVGVLVMSSKEEHLKENLGALGWKLSGWAHEFLK